MEQHSNELNDHNGKEKEDKDDTNRLQVKVLMGHDKLNKRFLVSLTFFCNTFLKQKDKCINESYTLLKQLWYKFRLNYKDRKTVFTVCF